MKMNLTLFFGCPLLLSSIILQGCSFWGPDKEKVKAKSDTEDALDEEATARCSGGNFSCSGNWKKWCAKMEDRCSGDGAQPQYEQGSCMPQCTWACESPKCDQVCAPKCGQAMCSTRCKGFNTQNCKMTCGKPDCKVVCPKTFCPGQNCASCKTECGKPICKMQCQDSEQPCRHVCAQPQCKWECKKPQECPKPKCEMKCEKPRNCMDNTHMVQQMPPLQPGETEVEAFQTPPHLSPGARAGAPAPAAAASPAAALISRKSKVTKSGVLATLGSASTLRVDITTMKQDQTLQKDQVDLEVVSMEAEPTTWTTQVKMNNGRMIESSASCKNGAFKCKGNQAWCSQESEMMICESAEAANAAEALESQEVAEAAAAQGALTPSEPVEVMKASVSGDSIEGLAETDTEAEEAAAQALQAAAKDDHSVFLQHRMGRKSE